MRRVAATEICPRFANFRESRYVSFDLITTASTWSMCQLRYIIIIDLESFSTCHQPSNILTQTVNNDIRSLVLQAGVKFLGLISKIAPLWQVLESPVQLSELNQTYHELLQYLDASSLDASGFLSGQYAPFGLSSVEMGQVYDTVPWKRKSTSMLFQWLRLCYWH